MKLLAALWFCWSWLAAPVYAPDVGRLAHPSFAARESAAAALSSPLAYPAIARAAESHADPEARSACRRLSAPFASRLADLSAWWLLIGPEPDPRALGFDQAGRERLAYWCGRWRLGTDAVPCEDEGCCRPPPAWELPGTSEWDDPFEALRALRRIVRESAGD